MGSFYKDGKSYRFKFVDHIGKTRRLNFGTQKVTKRDQGFIDSYVTHLVSSRENSTLIDPKVQQWLSGIKGSKVAVKLAEWGLIPEAGIATLGEFTEWYYHQKAHVWKDLDGNPEWSLPTYRTNQTTKNYLIQFFGKDRELHTITRGDADDFARWLRSDATRSSRKATISKHIRVTRHLFNYVWRKQWTRENPFDHIQYAIQVDRSRIHYMTVAQANLVLEELTCSQHRLFFSLARFAGLRLPSEVANMCWSDIDFDRKTITVPAEKTKERTMPLWKEIEPIAWEEFKSWQDSERSDDYVIYRHRQINRDGKTHVSTKMIQHMKAAFKRAGIIDFEKPMQNMRTSCENDLRQFLPEGQLTEFMGHSTKVAQLHYRKTTPAEYQKLSSIGREMEPIEVMERIAP